MGFEERENGSTKFHGSWSFFLTILTQCAFVFVIPKGIKGSRNENIWKQEVQMPDTSERENILQIICSPKLLLLLGNGRRGTPRGHSVGGVSCDISFCLALRESHNSSSSWVPYWSLSQPPSVQEKEEESLRNKTSWQGWKARLPCWLLRPGWRELTLCELAQSPSWEKVPFEMLPVVSSHCYNTAIGPKLKSHFCFLWLQDILEAFCTMATLNISLHEL